MRGDPPPKCLEWPSLGGGEALIFQQDDEGTKRDFLCGHFPEGSTQARPRRHRLAVE